MKTLDSISTTPTPTAILPLSSPPQTPARRRFKFCRAAAALVASLIFLLAGSVHAVDGTWDGGGGSGIWGGANNWVVNGQPANGVGAKAYFATAFGTYANSNTIIVNVPITLGQFQFTNTTRDIILTQNNGDPLTLAVSSGSPVINVSNAARSLTISSLALAGTNGLTKVGFGTLIFNAANTYSGNTIISAGTLTLSNNLAMQNSVLDTTASIAGTASAGLKTTVTTLTLGGLSGNKNLADVFTSTSGGYSGVTDLRLNPGVSASYSGSIADGAANMTLTKLGAGTQILSGNNTYSGGTTNSAGILTAANNDALGTGAVVINGGIRLVVNDSVTITNDITLNSASGVAGRGVFENSGAGNATLSGTITINGGIGAGGNFASVSGGTLTVAGPVNSTLAQITLRTGTAIFSGGGSYTNFGISGTARLGAANGFSTLATLNIGPSAAGTFDLAGYNQTLVGITTGANAATITNSTTTNAVLTLTGTSSYAGVIKDDGLGKISLTINGGNVTLSGVNTYSGATTITSAGKLTFSTAGSATSDVTVAGGATNGVLVASASGQWVNTGSLTNDNSSFVEVDYGSTVPSTTTAPIKVSNFSVGTGLALKVAGLGYQFTEGQDYPLVTWTGSGPSDTNAFANLDLPTSPAVTGYLTNSGTTLYLHVVTVAAKSWNVGDGDWDTTTPNWVDVALAPSTYNDLTDAVLFGDAPGATGNPIVNLTNAFAPLAVKMNSSSHDYTITNTLSGTGNIGGSGPLILEAGNTRTLTLATSNSYTGGTFISGGTLALSAEGTLGSTAGSLTLSGGRLDLGGLTSSKGVVSLTAAAASGDTITNGTLTATSYAASNPGGDAIISASLGGAATLTKSGAGTVTLTGADTYSGNLTVSGGTLNAWGARSGTLTNIRVSDTAGINATLNITNGTYAVASGQEFRVGLASPTAATGTVNQSGGAVTFPANGNQLLLGATANVTNTGIYNLSAGSITIPASANRGVILAVNSFNNGIFNLSGSGTLNLAATLQICRSETGATFFTNTTGAFNQTGGTATVGELRMAGNSAANVADAVAALNLSGGSFVATNFTALSGGINSTSSIAISGTADVTLPAFPTTRGTGSTATLTFDGGTLRPFTNSTAYMGGLTSAKIKAGGATVNVDSGKNITITQALLTDDVSTGGGLTKAGDGVLTLSGTNTYTGGTAVIAGKLAFSTAGSAISDVTVAGSATNGVLVATAGGQWVNTGSLTNNNSSVVKIDYGSTLPSTTTAPIQVNNFSVGTGLTLKVVGVGFIAGVDYPLVTWTGSGPANTNAFANLDLPRLDGYLSISANTLYLHVTTVQYLSWNTGDGDWDTTTFNWLDSNSISTNYTDFADLVLFNDAAGASGNPTVNLATAYSPLGVTMNSSSHDYTISGTGGIGGNGPLILDAANTRTLTLATTNTYTGNTTISGGTLQIGGAGRLGNGTYAGAISIATNAALLYSSSAAQTLSGVITGLGTLNYSPSVSNLSLTLSNTNNAHSGPTTINAGRIQINAIGALSPNTPITITGDSSYGGQLFFNAAVPTVPNNITISGVGYPDTGGRGGAIRATGVGQNFTGTITLAGDSRIGFISTAAAALTNSGRITGPYAMDFYGGLNANNVVSTLTLANTGTPNDFTGNASISCVDFSTAKTGSKTILQLGASDQIPNGAGKGSLVFNGANANHLTILELNGFNETLNGVANSAATGAIIRNTAIGDVTLTIGDADTNSAFSGVITDGGAGNTLALTKIGNGTLALSGPGPLVNGYPTASNNFSGNLTVTGGGTLVATGTATTSGNFSAFGYATNSRTITVNPGATLTFSAPNVLSRIWSQANVPTLLINGGTVGNADPLVSNRCNNALGTVILTNGTLSTSVGHHGGYGGWDINGTVTSSGSSSITSSDPTYATVVLSSAGPGLTPAYTTFDVTDGTLGISAPLTQNAGSGDERVSGLIKTGPGTLLLSGVSTYTGGTVINAGTLGGTGTLAGALTNNAGGTLAPGSGGIGTLTLGGDLTLNADSTNTFEVNGSTPANDVIVLGGIATYGGVLNIIPSGTFTPGQTFTLFSGVGATNASSFANLLGSPGGGNSFSFTNGVLTVVGTGPSGPALLTNSVSGGVLSLSWPAGQGWRLEYQTNALNVGLATNWVEAAGSSVNSTNITIDGTKPTVFYRLIYP